MTVWIGFENKEQIIEEFRSDRYEHSSACGPDGSMIEQELEHAIIHIAWLGEGCYCAAAHVIFTDVRGTLKEVHGSHCSCNGFEGSWEPSETSKAALLQMAKAQLESLSKWSSSYDDEQKFHEAVVKFCEG